MARTNSNWIIWVFFVASAAIAAPPALAQNDRIFDTPTAWSYLYGANSTQISNQIAAGFRPFSLEYVGSGAYDTVFVSDSGPYAVTGETITLGRTPSSMSSYLAANNLRLLDLEVYDSGGSTRMSAIALPNSGPTGTPAWGWLYNTSFTAIVNWLADNPSLRLIDLDVYSIGGTQYYSAVAVHNSGANAQGWWYYSGLTSAQVTQALIDNGARLVSLQQVSPGTVFTPPTFACVMVSSNPGAHWWYASLSIEEVTSLLEQNGARVTCLKRYQNQFGQTRWSVAMVDNVNTQTRRMRHYMGNGATTGAYGFKLKQVGGPVLASLNENFAFEPASMLKILHATYAIRQCSFGLDNLAADIFVLDTCNPNQCPDEVGCLPGLESLSTAIRQMMENSDNNRTWEIEDRYGRATLNTFAGSRGLTSTYINHRLGCLCGMPFNSFNCASAVSLYEQIANGSIFSESWRDMLFNLMTDLDSQGFGAYPTLSAMINQEAAATSLNNMELIDFRARVRFANKGGGYSCGSQRWRTDGAWASIPFKVFSLGQYLTVDREYAIATFVDDGRDPHANIAYSAKEEILREQVRAALQSWDAACGPPSVVSQPADAEAPLGGSESFSVSVTGAGTNTYRWQRLNPTGVWINVSDIAGRFSGATTNQLTISNIVAADAGQYRLHITKVCGSIFSNAATLAIVGDCAADWNDDTTVNSSDISAFLTAWLSSLSMGNLIADFNGDLSVNSSDISAFLTAWLDAVQNGC